MGHTEQGDLPPWRVAGLPHALTKADTEGWRYVVVEEIVDDLALLRRWTWPMADPVGHLVWDREEEQDSTAIAIWRLREQLYAPSGVQREPRVGDTFAVVADTAVPRWPARTRSVGQAMAGRVFDVSAEARWAARLAQQGSLAAVLPAPRLRREEGAPAAAPRRYAAPELTVSPQGEEGRTTR